MKQAKRKTNIDTAFGIFERPDFKTKLLRHGSLSGKYPVVLDGGRTTIYIKDPSKEASVRARYEKHTNSI